MWGPEQDAGVVVFYCSPPYWADTGSLTETVGCISAQLASPFLGTANLGPPKLRHSHAWGFELRFS